MAYSRDLIISEGSIAPITSATLYERKPTGVYDPILTLTIPTPSNPRGRSWVDAVDKIALISTPAFDSTELYFKVFDRATGAVLEEENTSYAAINGDVTAIDNTAATANAIAVSDSFYNLGFHSDTNRLRVVVTRRVFGGGWTGRYVDTTDTNRVLLAVGAPRAISGVVHWPVIEQRSGSGHPLIYAVYKYAIATNTLTRTQVGTTSKPASETGSPVVIALEVGATSPFTVRALTGRSGTATAESGMYAEFDLAESALLASGALSTTRTFANTVHRGGVIAGDRLYITERGATNDRRVLWRVDHPALVLVDTSPATGLDVDGSLDMHSRFAPPDTHWWAQRLNISSSSTLHYNSDALAEIQSTLVLDEPGEVFGSAHLSAALTIAASATRVQHVSAELQASATLTATPTRVVAASADLSALAVASANALAVRYATATLTAEADLTASTVGIIFASAALIAATDLTANALAVRGATATLTAVGTMASQATRVRSGALALQATATLTANALRVRHATLALDPTATLTANALRARLVAADLQATLTLEANSVGVSLASAALDATLTLTAVPTRVVAATLTLTASATLDATATTIRTTSATLTAEAALYALPASPTDAADLQATLTLTAVPTRARTTSVALTTEAELAASPTRVRPATLTLDATATLYALATRVGSAQLDLLAEAILTADATVGTPIQNAEAHLSATALLATNASVVKRGGATLSAALTLQATALRARHALAQLDATAQLQATPTKHVLASADVQALATLYARANIVRYAHAELQALATLTAIGGVAETSPLGLILNPQGRNTNASLGARNAAPGLGGRTTGPGQNETP
ncbi:MAG: hypothetical protein H0U69_03520 [Trueperaceae bacterium]|nr:hypothetical protein [Trueperaceae bacterium]